MPKKTKPKNAKPSKQKKVSKPIPKKSPSPSKPEKSWREKFPQDKIDRLHGRKGMPPTTPKFIPEGQTDDGQMTADPSKKHLTVADLIKLLGKIKNPAKKRVWFDGSQYWGRMSGLREFDHDGKDYREVLLEKGN